MYTSFVWFRDSQAVVILIASRPLALSSSANIEGVQAEIYLGN
jgi:hypothetical protein